MSRERNGGAAFPYDKGLMADQPQTGMSLRDWFAGQALAGLLAHASGEAPSKAPAEAYNLADAMIKVRGEHGQG